MADKQKNGEKEMSFLDHLEELRWHLVRSVAAIVIFAIVAFMFPKIIFDVVIFGPARENFITYKWLCQLSEVLNIPTLCFGKLPFEDFQNIQMGSQFTWHIWASLIAGFVVAFPYVVWEFWRFIRPALYTNEKRNIGSVVFFVSLLFFTGVAFGYFILSPLTVNFLVNYDVMAQVDNKPVFTSYFSTILNLILWTGIVFELPILVYFLAKVGLVSPKFLKRYRKHAIVMIMILSAIITPPDIASQILVSIPLIGLYEISIIIARRVYKEA